MTDRRSRGVLAGLLVGLLTVVALVGGVQVLTLARTAEASRATAWSRIQAADRLALSALVLEAVQGAVAAPAAERRAELHNVLTTGLRWLGETQPGGWSIQLGEASAELELPLAAPLPAGTAPASLEPVGPDLQGSTSADWVTLAGPRVARAGPFRFSFVREAEVLGQRRRATFAWSADVAAVPLTRFDRVDTLRPEALGDLDLADRPAQGPLVELVAAPGKGGRRAGVDPRLRAAWVEAHAALFSRATLDRAAASAGPTHTVDLSQPLDPEGVLNPVLDGLSQAGVAWVIDVSAVRRGWRVEPDGSRLEHERDTLVVLAPAGGRLLVTDSGREERPLYLVVAAPPGEGAGPSLEVELASILRPAVVVSWGARWRTANATAAAAFFLDARSDWVGTATVAHLTSRPGSAPGVRAVGGLDLEAERLAPRVHLARVREVEP